MKNNQIEKVYPLSPMQEGMLFHSLLGDTQHAYFEQMRLIIQGDLNVSYVEQSLNHLISKYDIFRTLFLYEKLQRPRQVVLKERKTTVAFHNIVNLSCDEQTAHIEALLQADRERGFDLSKDILMRISIILTKEKEYQLVWSHHHILMDGWCFGIVMQDFFRFYKMLVMNQALVKEKTTPYSSYIHWLQKQDQTEAITYWENYLSAYEKPAVMAHQFTHSDGFAYGEVTVPVDKELSAGIYRIAREHQTTSNNVFQAIWGLLLQRYNNTSDVVFGSVVSGRPSEIEDVEQIVGLFINTVPVRIKSGNEQTFSQLLNAVKQNSLEAKSYEYVSLADIQSRSGLGSDLFNHIIGFQNHVDNQGLYQTEWDKELGFTVVSVDAHEMTNYDFHLVVIPGDLFTIRLSYNANKYDQAFIERIGAHLTKLMKQVIAEPHQAVHSYELVTDEEKQQLLATFNSTAVDFPNEKTLHQLFEEQVARTPNAIAIAYNEQSLTYQQLDEKANQLARVLRRQGVGPNQLVGIVAERSIEMVVGLFAILKAGGAYVPIDPEYPKERIEYILTDSHIELVLIQEHLHKTITSTLGENVSSYRLISITTGNDDTDNSPLESVNRPSDLAYMIYTSGTTGKPKGVMIEHRNVVNTIYWRSREYQFCETDSVLQLFSFAFDGFVISLFSPLIAGAKAVILPTEDAKDPVAIKRHILRWNVTSFITVPVMYSAIIDTMTAEETQSLRLICLGADKLTENVIRQSKNLNARIELINEYGPTENAIVSTFSRNMRVDKPITIGGPIANTRAYVLTAHDQLQPIGISGELCVSGVGLARGYHNLPELTAEKFVASPFEPDERMYRTGDIVSWTEDGNLIFHGRIDNQVKIRGHRIETGEIETLLRKHPAINEAVITVQEIAGDAVLCAYYVPADEVSINELRDYMSTELPDYMMPAYFIELQSLPLTVNGKVDHKSLPMPENIFSESEYVAPKNQTQEQLAKIWVDVLGLTQVGITDNFFERGGHSIKATLLVARIHKQFGIVYPLKEVFNRPTIEEMAAYITQADKDALPPLIPTEARDFYPATSAQKRLYVSIQFDGAELTYNMPLMVRLNGLLDVESLQDAVRALTRRHESLRTSFVTVEDKLMQQIHKDVEMPFSYIETTEDLLQEEVQTFIQPFDLSQAPLSRVGLFQIGKQEHLLVLDMHHIISDGVSMNIFLHELTQLYARKELPPLAIQYKDYAVWQQAIMESGAAKVKEKYWLDTFSGDIPVLELATDFPRPTVQEFAGSRIQFELTESQSERLLTYCNERGSTLYMTLLAALNVLLHKYTGQNDIVIGTPIAGRQLAELEHVMGMFVNTLAMRNQLESDETFNQFLGVVQANSLKAFENQDYPLETLIEKLDVQRDISRNPLFDIMFSLQNIEVSTFAMANLEMSSYEFTHEIAKFDMTVVAAEREGKIVFDWEYRTQLFCQETIERMIQHYLSILNQVIADPNIKLRDIDMMTDAEKEHLLTEINNTFKSIPQDVTALTLFEQVAVAMPEQIAVVFGAQQLTYRELDEKASLLAQTLRTKGVGQEDIVAILSDRSLEMIIGLIAIVKAGAAFLPIDPEYPTERIEYMLSDSKAKILLVHRNRDIAAASEEWTDICETLLLTDDRLYQVVTDEPLDAIVQPDSLAYVIYTSGSTGQPKGVMIEHHSLVNLCLWHQTSFDLTAADHTTKYAGFGFDASVWEIFPTLITGATLHIIPDDIRLDAELLNHYFEVHGITVSFLPTQMCELFQELDNRSLRVLLTGGDKLKTFIPRSYQLINNYGPTENTVVATSTLLTQASNNLPIGRPIQNVQALVLSSNGQLQPIGVPGELCIGGAGLARGYLNRPDLTAEKFVSHPLLPEQTIYRTGDFVRISQDGQLEYLGRIDQQVKIRGYRIELGEIETRMLQYPGVKEAVVTAFDTNLCAYYVATEELSDVGLRQYLNSQLPPFMVPTFFIQLDSLPLTANGKVDRRALPEPDSVHVPDRPFEPPISELEQRLADIWGNVLQVERIGRNDHFFERGGHSIRATTVISRIQKEFGVKVPLSAFFQKPTLQELADCLEQILQQQKEENSSDELTILPVGTSDYYPASSAQKRMYVVNQFAGVETAYNMPLVLEINGPLNIPRFTGVIEKLIERHEALRTSFAVVDGEVVQRIHPRVKLLFELIQTSKAKRDEMIKQAIQPFDLGQAPLMRSRLIQLDEQSYVAVIDMHHIISDGVSMSLFMDEFSKLYAGETLPELQIQYKDYAVWQQQRNQLQSFATKESYWLNQFADEIPVLELQTDYPRSVVKQFAGEILQTELPAEWTAKLQSFNQNEQVTLFMTLLALYQMLLAKYTDQEDICVGTPIAGRPTADVDRVMGMFVNTLALRNQPEAAKSFRQFIAEVRESVLLAYEHQDYPLEELIEKLGLARDTSRNPLFDTMFTLQNLELASVQLTDVAITALPYEMKKAKFDLTLLAIETDGKIYFNWEYSSHLFKRETIERMANHLNQLIIHALKHPNSPISDIQMMTAEEENQLLKEFNSEQGQAPITATIPQLFEQQASLYPDKIALVFEKQEWSYRQLNEQANLLAHALQARGVGREEKVGLIIDRSPMMIVAMLAVLKAGGAYVPIDPEYPIERIRFMLADTKTRLVLSQSHLIKNFTLDQELINLDDPTLLHQGDVSNPEAVDLHSQHLAYVMFTSGTTGQPKGTLTTHANIIRVVKDTNYVDLNRTDTLLQISNYVFDGSTFDIYGALLNGAKLVMMNRHEMLDVHALSYLITTHRISVIFMTTALFHTLVDVNLECLGNVRKLFVGGEKMSPKQARKALAYLGPDCFYNIYGPTESTVFATYYHIFEIKEDMSSIPIGKPLSRTQLYVLNKHLHLVPIGVPGELYIGGEGLIRGYLNRQDLTDEKFIPSPFNPEERLYKTGDLVRWLPDGNIEYLDRADNLVKIRGFRIEPDEIAVQMKEHPQVKEAVVLVKHDQTNQAYLCAYFSAHSEIGIAELRDHLSNRMPEYMIPAVFMELEMIPFTPNGKLDRRALPEPSLELYASQYVPPTTPTEERLCQIWSEVLGVEKIGVHDNFFERGGHSLRATMLSASIEKQLEVEFSIQQVFLHQTVKEMANAISISDRKAYHAIQPVEKRAYYPTSPSQRRLYFINQFEGASISYNMPLIVRLDGDLDLSKLQNALDMLIQRHEAFRTSFEMRGEEVIQLIHDQVSLPLTLVEIDEETLRRTLSDYIQPFDLSKAPLIRAMIFRVTSKQHVLLIDMHHIISDGTSLTLFLHELNQLYLGNELSSLTIQYKDYAVWQREQCQVSGREERFWLDTFAGELPVLEMPTDHSRPTITDYAGDVISFELDKQQTAQLLTFVHETNTTLYMNVLAAYNLFLARYTGQDDIIVGTPTAGRLKADVEHVIGMFVNTLAIRNSPVMSKSFREFLGEVKANVLHAYEYQTYPLEELIEKLDIQRDRSRNPLFDTMLTVQNIEFADNTISGLKMTPYEYTHNAAKFDLTLSVLERDSKLYFEWEYRTSLYKRTTMERMAKHFLTLLMGAITQPDLSMGQLIMVNEAEKQQLIYDFNQTDANYPRESTIHAWIEKQVRLTPDRVAVTYGDKHLTYRELDEQANRLANRLLQQSQHQRNPLIGILLDRSERMIISILAILKAGGAYVPIDPEYPVERIAAIVEDTGMDMLITESHHAEIYEAFAEVHPINIDQLDEWEKQPAKLLTKPIGTQDDLAYIIFTSGSTGRPKGVMIEHRNVIRLMTNDRMRFDFTDNDVWTMFHSYCFDFSVWEMYGALFYGGRVVIVPKEIARVPKDFIQLLKQERVTVLNQTPTAFYSLIQEEAKGKEKELAVRYVIFGGEALAPIQLHKFHERYPATQLINMYGITETTVHVTFKEITLAEMNKNQPNIGTPIPTLTVYILDEFQQPVPIGVKGEIYVGGEGVARGYLHQPDLTAERFVPNPFIPDQKMYRAGDLARWLDDGTLEYLGRLDHQVKVRGFRIELGEIETCLLQHDAINEALVIAIDDAGSTALCAYYIATHELSISELRRHIGETLPSFMIPAYFIGLDTFPMTVNGKVDRKALPKPDASTLTLNRYVEPQGELEEKLDMIWSEVLGRSRVGREGNFFELGGHSLKAASLISLMHKETGVKVPLKVLFQTPILWEVAEYIKKQDAGTYIALELLEKRPYYKASPYQRYTYERAAGEISYNIPFAITLEGKLNVERLRDSFQTMINRHESLRSSFDVVDDEVVLVVHDELCFDLPVMVAEEEQVSELVQAQVRPFDFHEAPLLRAVLIRSEEEKHTLFVDMNHIISDGTSLSVFMDELMQLYAGHELPELTVQYKEYTYWLDQWLTSEEGKRQEQFWLKYFDGDIPQLELPTDFPRPDQKKFDGEKIFFQVDAKRTKLLHEFSEAHSVTIYITLLSAFYVLLQKYTDQEDIIVGTWQAGRPREEFNRVIGLFINTLAFRANPRGDLNFQEFLTDVKENIVHCYENQLYPFEMITEKLAIPTVENRTPLFDAVFSMLNYEMNDIEFDSLHVVPHPFEFKICEYDIYLEAIEKHDFIHFSLGYSVELFKQSTIEEMAQDYLSLLDELLNNAQAKLAEVGITIKDKQAVKNEVRLATSEVAIAMAPELSPPSTNRIYPETVPYHPFEPTKDRVEVINRAEFGDGVISKTIIQPGEIVFRFDGPQLPYQTLYTLQKHSGLFVEDPYCMGKVLHSCDPNTVVDMDTQVFTAVKEIKPGDYITMDYETTEDELYRQFECGCGASKCRKIITGRFMRARN
ncbi:non-ribosomal peptide synthetase [Brevibacillus laterosporus]|uniref:NRPS domain-containing protein n=1 Tax=Brevibacillus laterosporus LMG 15441 TaxID=1042163 RepID=A0A075RBA6_BRELA|nr:non-ribosomal peptide synthetase [Brevibacillus laterosporus]AIG26780.1 NRPS domain-containing protein [Brevibacillus laterosporus LMG 15441]RJL13999.1 non-ribosomal peptide synthetase [Brevibacillus laterosporus]